MSVGSAASAWAVDRRPCDSSKRGIGVRSGDTNDRGGKRHAGGADGRPRGAGRPGHDAGASAQPGRGRPARDSDRASQPRSEQRTSDGLGGRDERRAAGGVRKGPGGGTARGAVRSSSQRVDPVQPRADRPHVVAPEIPDDVVAADLDRVARGRLRTLSKDNADGVARHLVMACRLLDEDPETAYLHAQAALRRAGRVDVVREAAGITAYRTGRFAEALRELRTVRRLNGSEEHIALMADCERGLGRPERALALVAEAGEMTLPAELQVELAIVAAGARQDLGQLDAALAALRSAVPSKAEGELRLRVLEATASVLVALGRETEARQMLGDAGIGSEPAEDVVVFDLDEESEGGAADAAEGHAEGAAGLTQGAADVSGEASR